MKLKHSLRKCMQASTKKYHTASKPSTFNDAKKENKRKGETLWALHIQCRKISNHKKIEDKCLKQFDIN